MEDSEFLSKWEITRKKGILFYILTKELILIIGSLIGCILGITLKNKALPNISDILFNSKPILLGSIVGAFIGAILWWNFNERKYKILLKEHKSKI